MPIVRPPAEGGGVFRVASIVICKFNSVLGGHFSVFNRESF